MNLCVLHIEFEAHPNLINDIKNLIIPISHAPDQIVWDHSTSRDLYFKEV